ncbi:hypothetical protein [Flavobacterium sp. B17]|uniref:hypothetical protein n=1 Tax=Flavobacterium sp. B17 TaxID=95618 RepID=UPI00034B7BE2|nr:hypothetical protein [Flavobacterium sp. B17]
MKKTIKSFKDFEIKKSPLSSMKGGTSTTVMIETGYTENEYPDNGSGEPDFDYEPVVVEIPSKPKKKLGTN